MANNNSNVNHASSKKFWKIFGIVTGLTVDFGLTIFFFVISIIMISKAVAQVHDDPRTFIGWLQNNTTVYLCGFVVPLFILLAINIIILVVYIKKTNARKKIEVNELSEDQLNALKAELLNDLKSGSETKEKKENE